MKEKKYKKQKTNKETKQDKTIKQTERKQKHRPTNNKVSSFITDKFKEISKTSDSFYITVTHNINSSQQAKMKKSIPDMSLP